MLTRQILNESWVEYQLSCCLNSGLTLFVKLFSATLKDEVICPSILFTHVSFFIFQDGSGTRVLWNITRSFRSYWKHASRLHFVKFSRIPSCCICHRVLYLVSHRLNFTVFFMNIKTQMYENGVESKILSDSEFMVQCSEKH